MEMVLNLEGFRIVLRVPAKSRRKVHNVVSISGGKDSTAMALLAIERQTENLHFVFCDTGHEHQWTYDYVDYLDGELRRLCGVGIQRLRADFSAQIARKRELVKEKWPSDGVSPEHVEKALSLLHPTGNPFLDLCISKGRFPGTRTRFCSEELKHNPIARYIEELLPDTVLSWQGVRRDESESRANLPEKDVEMGTWEPEPRGHLIYRPILDWKAEDCFAMHRKHGIRWNPLYEQGMGRVGCMPCIHVTKGELKEIATRFPEEIERVRRWEEIVSATSKMGASTLLDGRVSARYLGTSKSDIRAETHGIHVHAEWARTARGGVKGDDLIPLVPIDEAPSCTSIYGLCE